MQKGSKSGGGQGLPDRAAEEQATTRGERGFERASRAEILYVHCLRFLSGPFYIVVDYIADPALVGIAGRFEVHLSLEIYGPSSAARRRYKNLHQYRKTVPGRAGGVADR